MTDLSGKKLPTVEQVEEIMKQWGKYSVEEFADRFELDKEVIDRAKVYARSHRTSLSKLVKSFFESLTGPDEVSGQELSPFVQQISGVVELPEDFDLKDDLTEILDEKYR